MPTGADLEIRGLTTVYVANDDFFRIDTALRVPVADPATWRLHVRGRVDRPFSLTYEELLDLPQIEADITLTCVSNEVGGDLVGNARWQGVPLVTLLEGAGVQAGDRQIIGRSVDGFTAGFPTLTAIDVEEAMVAVGMNGVPLPAEHGFPARLVVPGPYGYVSATKWISAIELTDFDEPGYWFPRGWAKEGPIKTAARIDVARADAPGRGVIAGVAWAPTRGVQGVEVRVDNGPWVPATLAEQLDVDCWRQWYLPWDAPPGLHKIAARATDRLGELQTDQRTLVAPDGASGYAAITGGGLVVAVPHRGRRLPGRPSRSRMARQELRRRPKSSCHRYGCYCATSAGGRGADPAAGPPSGGCKARCVLTSPP